MSLGIVVIAGTGNQNGTGVLYRLAIANPIQLPALLRTTPVRGFQVDAKVNVVTDVVGLRGLGQILANGGAVGQYLIAIPGAKAVAEGEHIGIRANPRVAKQVPGATDARAALQNRKFLLRAVPHQVAGGADTGQAGADDQGFEMLYGHRGLTGWTLFFCPQCREFSQPCEVNMGPAVRKRSVHLQKTQPVAAFFDQSSDLRPQAGSVRSSRRRILPTVDFGSSLWITICLGTL